MKLSPLTIKKNGKIIDIRGKVKRFTVVDYVTLRQSTYPKKIFVLQNLLFKNGKNELRIGYYIIGKKPRMRGKWVWGQFAPFFPKSDLKKLLAKARRKGII